MSNVSTNPDLNSSMAYIKITTHLKIDGTDIFATTGDGLYDNADAAFAAIFDTIEKSI
jgi:hypothetical protein